MRNFFIGTAIGIIIGVASYHDYLNSEIKRCARYGIIVINGSVLGCQYVGD